MDSKAFSRFGDNDEGSATVALASGDVNLVKLLGTLWTPWFQDPGNVSIHVTVFL